VLGFAEAFGATLGSFLGPTFVGLLIISGLAKVLKPRYLAAFTIGIYLWFFSDTIGDAVYLNVDQGFTGGIWQAVLFLTFGIGLVLMFSLDRDMFAEGPEAGRLGFTIPILVAIAIGVHGFGEGAGIGSTAATTPASDILDAFGGLSGAVAFLLHKCLEPMMAGAAYWLYAKDHAHDVKGRLTDLVILTVAFTIPGIVGSGVAYYLVQGYPNVDFTYVFGFGLGTSIYALARLARPLFWGESRHDSWKVGLIMILGFACLYTAALFHS
jgi:zinc transporter ZupT